MSGLPGHPGEGVEDRTHPNGGFLAVLLIVHVVAICAAIYTLHALLCGGTP